MSERLNYQFNTDPDVPGQREEYEQTFTLEKGLTNALLFNIPAHSTDCTDGTKMYIELVFKVLKENGENLDATDDADLLLCNGAFGNFFSTVNVSLNGCALPTNSDAAYTNFLVKILGSSKDYRKSVLKPLSWTDVNYDRFSAITATNHIGLQRCHQEGGRLQGGASQRPCSIRLPHHLRSPHPQQRQHRRLSAA